MKFIVMLFVCLLIAPAAFAMEKTSTKKQVNKSWKPIAFDETAARLPVGYNGLDAKQFYKLFKSKVGKLKKGEFETTEEFEKRTEDKDVLLAPINTSALYAFRIDYINSKYNADSQTYETDNSGSVRFCSDDSPLGWVTCKLDSISHKERKYTGNNSFGATINITKRTGLNFALAIPKKSSAINQVFEHIKPGDGHQGGYLYRDKFDFPLVDARKLGKKNISVLFVGRVTDAKILEGRSLISEPTIDYPFDDFIQEEAMPFELKKIIYYVVQTGEILHQKSF